MTNRAATPATPAPPKKPRRTNGRGMKQKGDRLEREIAAYMTARLGDHIEVRRAPLSGGGVIHGLSGGSDLSGTLGLHCEVKAVERLSFPDAMRQAQTSLAKTQAPEIPVVINRRSRQKTGESYVLLTLDDFLDLYESWLLAGRPRTRRDP